MKAYWLNIIEEIHYLWEHEKFATYPKFQASSGGELTWQHIETCIGEKV